MYTASWQRGAQGMSRRFATVLEAEAWIRLAAGGLATSAERCHLRVVEGVPTPWTTSRVVAHYTHEARSVGWRLTAGRELGGVADYALPMAQAAE